MTKTTREIVRVQLERIEDLKQQRDFLQDALNKSEENLGLAQRSLERQKTESLLSFALRDVLVNFFYPFFYPFFTKKKNLFSGSLRPRNTHPWYYSK